MRILSVEAHNLTSLPEFSVHFDQPPLREAGIFAITGPTGAGKSSILDAICLALYNSTPRMAEGGTVVWTGVQGELSSKNPAGLMRRGAVKTWVKVRFVGKDRQVYRSEWTVHRAREKVEGKLQEPVLRLYEESTGRQLSGGTTTETLKLIEKHVGLSFDQFRRAVLLAQGEFAAFLKADYDQRSLLLEQLTGQVLYTHVSKMAFDRARSANATLAGLEKERAECEVLEPDSRRQQQELLKIEQEQLALLEQQQEQAAATRRWVQEEQQRLLRLQKAEGALVAVQQDWPPLAAVEAEIRAVEAAEDCREPLRQVDEAARGLVKVQERRLKEEEAERKGKGEVEKLEAQQEEAQRRQKAAEGTWEQLQPALTEARRLDALLIEAEADHRNAATQHQEAQKAQRQAQQILVALQQRFAEGTLQRARNAQWLDAQQIWEQRSADFSLWEKLLQDSASMLRRSKVLAGEGAELEPRLRELERRLGQAKQAHGEARAVLEAREKALAEAEACCVDPAPLRRQQGGIQAGLDGLAALQRQVEEGLRLKMQQEEDEARRQKIEGELSEAVSKRSTLKEELERLRPLIEQARKDRDQAVAFEELAARRAALRPGEPCILCGAVDHPWAHRPLEQLSGDLRAELLVLERQQQQIHNGIATQDAVEKQNRYLLDSLVQALTKLQNQREALRGQLRIDLQRWKESQNLPDLPVAPELVGSLRLVEEQLRGQLRAVIQELDQADKADKVASAARLQRAAASTALETARSAEETAQKAVDQAQIQKARFDTEQSQLRQELDKIHGRLPADLQGEDALGLLRKGVGTWKEKNAAQQQLQTELDRLESQQEAQTGQVAELEQRVQQAAESLEQRQNRLGTLRVERAGFLEGRPVATVEKEVRAAQKDAEELLKLAMTRLAAARAAQAAALEALVGTQAEEASAVLQQQAVYAALQQSLGSRDEATIRQILAHDGRWIQENRAKIAAWRERDTTARSEKATLLQLVEEHRRTPPPMDPAAAQQSLEEGPQQRALRLEQIQTIQTSLRRDDDQQDRLEKLRPQLVIAEGDARKWAEISDLIGSADGQKFRAFAQGLTLDVLIGAANRNLGLLNNRYQLAKAPNPKNEPKGDMNLQVIDRDMGDEIRPISSLSGGELFLTSLALALALADLASHRSTRVETVFIDEGFGSLDTRTLDMALSALEALSDEGRQVGIVSHVAGLHERIGVQVQVRKIDAVKGSEVRVVRR